MMPRRPGSCVLWIGLLLALANSASADPFTIKCDRGGRFWLTFDVESRRMIYEIPYSGLGQGPAYKGWITSATDDEIHFEALSVSRSNTPMVWNRRSRTVKESSGLSDAAALTDCVLIETRPVLSLFDSIAPYDK